MAGKKGSSNRKGERTRINPITGQAETVTGTKAGKKRTHLPYGHQLRTHDLSRTERERRRQARQATD